MTTTSKRLGSAQPPAGQIRRSQIVGTFGPGALVDMVHDAGLVCGLEHWSDRVRPMERVDEPRLREHLLSRPYMKGTRLHQDHPFKAPPVGESGDPTKRQGIEVLEFPSWFVCQDPECRALVRASSLVSKNDRYLHDCTKRGSECVPVRFVAACENGHIDDFDWQFFVHRGAACSSPELRLKEGPSGDFSSLQVSCARCGQSRLLIDARVDAANPRCNGARPWLSLSRDDRVECTMHQRLLIRTATGGYFGVVESALSIPPQEHVADVRVAENWSVLQAATSSTLPAFRMIPSVAAAIEGLDDAAVLAAVERKRTGTAPPVPELRRAEYEVFVGQGFSLEQPPQGPDASFAAERVEVAGLPAGVDRVVLAHKLREVRAQVGFVRIKPPPMSWNSDVQRARLQPLSLTQDWLPAVEIRGEGIFVRLDPERVAQWEARPAVLARARQLEQAIVAAQLEPPGPIARFFLVHSLAHLMITAVSLECGYAASAIRERIYCAARDQGGGMAAFLLSTGSPGTDGTLGGLVEQGRRLDVHLRRALSMARLCSSDPVCAAREPGQLQMSPDGAACHACLYVGESSCEHFNRFLDRALVVPVVGGEPGLSFFGEAECGP